MSDPKLVNEYEAAIEFGFSPTLLRWLTENQVLGGTTLPFKEKNAIYWFNTEDIKALDARMAGKWKLPPKGHRPTIPAGINKEIKEEAQFACPACHRTPCEIAHISAVASTLCNHPKNLIFLCSNHHTEYDLGHIYCNISHEDVIAFKDTLRRYNKILWSIKGDIIKSYLGALNATKSLLEVHKVVSHSLNDETFKKALDDIAISVEKLKPVARRVNTDAITVAQVEEEIVDYKKSHSDNLCPLCKGQGSTSFYEPCPICLGNGEVPKNDPRLDRVGEFELIECSLCEGSGEHNNDLCPPCAGTGKVPRGWSEHHDWSQYDQVECRLCKGTGEHNDDTCPPCEGTGQLPRGWSEHHDWSQYDQVDCRHCKGTGEHNDDTCPPCEGTGQLLRGWSDNHDWSQYDLIKCRGCNGTGEHNDDTCPFCEGSKQLPRGWSDKHDWSQHEEC